MINRKFIHFESYNSFKQKRLSADPENISFTIGGKGEIYNGEPEISYQSIVFIKDHKLIFTHGQIYNASGDADKFKQAISLNGTDFDGSQDIITEIWGETRDISISDSTGTNIGSVIPVNGGENVVLPLPQDIDANVTNDSSGRNIVETYTTKQELEDALNEHHSFLVFSGDSATLPTMNNEPAVSWEERDYPKYSGSYYITTEGRIFQFQEKLTEGVWEWKELTDHYLYECLETLRIIKNKLDLRDYMEGIQDSFTTGNIIDNEVVRTEAYLDVLSCHQDVQFKTTTPTIIYIPYIYGNSWVRTKTENGIQPLHYITIPELNKLIGKTIVVNNVSVSTENLTINVGPGEDRLSTSLEIEPGKLCLLRFCATEMSGTLNYYWEASIMNPSYQEWN